MVVIDLSNFIMTGMAIGMMAAHPDRSGTSETADEFRQYKKMWEELKGGR